MMSVENYLSIARRYLQAVADGKIEARKLVAMSDEELKAYDQEAFDALEAKQEEAEALVNQDKTK